MTGDRAALRFAVFDLDGTLIGDDGRPFDGVVAGLDAVRRAGLELVVVTGRSAALCRALGLDDELFAKFHLLHLVSEGNAVYDQRSDSVSYRRTVHPGLPYELLARGMGDLVVERDHHYLASSPTAALWFARTHGVRRASVPVDPALGDPGGTVGSVLVLGNWAPAPAEHRDGYEVVPYAATAARLVRPVGTCKLRALREHLARTWGEPDLRRVVAFGDGRNDRCLLAAARVAVATQASHPVSRRHATMVLTTSTGAFLRSFDPAKLVHRSTSPAGCAH